VLARAVGERKVLDLRALEPAQLVEPYLFVEQVPEGAVVLDCRSPHQYRAWHYPGAELVAPHEVAPRMKALSKERTYVLYCDYGTQTAHLAELMQRVGYEAYSFRGGAPRLRDWTARSRARAGATS
jgi:thiamine biosynthesis protein ThiI